MEVRCICDYSDVMCKANVHSKHNYECVCLEKGRFFNKKCISVNHVCVCGIPNKRECRSTYHNCMCYNPHSSEICKADVHSCICENWYGYCRDHVIERIKNSFFN